MGTSAATHPTLNGVSRWDETKTEGENRLRRFTEECEIEWAHGVKATDDPQGQIKTGGAGDDAKNAKQHEGQAVKEVS